MTPDSLHAALNQQGSRLLEYHGRVGSWRFGGIPISFDALMNELLVMDAVTDPLRESLDSDFWSG